MSRPKPKRALVLGSGALQIGQAGEFDYSGTQALKALKEEGIHTVLISPNVATIQTTERFADEIYFLPIDPHFVERVLITEAIDSLLIGFGGQTALNCGLALEESGVIERLGVQILGTPLEAVRAAEDREIFKQKLDQISVRFARSRIATSQEEAVEAARDIGYPLILRAGYSLGGKGSAIVRDPKALEEAAARAFAGAPQVLVEECLSGWKEIEYEIVRDARDNCIAVCNMENVDPMGIHTGESIVVAPSQTLNDEEYQLLRDVALRTIRHLGIVGECNVQFALDRHSSEYRVIEVNPRLSRSSALASKATGYPLAYIAAKIALGYDLPDLQNAITRTTSAFFEPALDYIVCKIPRWDFDKFNGADARIGTEMKSVGEVMAIGRSFSEALQKAMRMLDVGANGFDPDKFTFSSLEDAVAEPSPRRIFAIATALAEGMSVDEIAERTDIDRFFLADLASVIAIRSRLIALGEVEAIDQEALREAKRAGFSDAGIARLFGCDEYDVAVRRRTLGIRPRLAQIDTLAAEYPAETNYLYLTYAAGADDLPPTNRRKVLILGSGCYRIGSSVEFDWCCVSAALAAREHGFETLLLNCNPETVSTDYDICDRLIFDEITFESVLEIVAHEQPDGVLVNMGGQTPNNLAIKLHRAGIPILGTPAEAIDRAENRKTFSALCDELGIDQPAWAVATAQADLEHIVASVGGFPVVVRPSYVLSGSAMRVAHGIPELRSYLTEATDVSPDHPVVLSKFEENAREIEFDAVAKEGEIRFWAISEHVEHAGVHSGDATLILPPKELYIETIRSVRCIGERLARALAVTGPFNVQILSRQNRLKVIECNLRASRSFPFVSKALGVNFIGEATALILGVPTHTQPPNPIELEYVAVKAPQFSFRRLSGVDPILGVEMASTGEAACFGVDVDEALLKAMLATGFRIPSRGVLLSLGPIGSKYRFGEEAQALLQRGLRLYATEGTAKVLQAEGLPCDTLDKTAEGTKWPRAIDYLREGLIDLVINIPIDYDDHGRPDGFLIRRAAIDLEIPLVTDLRLARRIVRAMTRYRVEDLAVKSWNSYLQGDFMRFRIAGSLPVPGARTSTSARIGESV